MAIAHSKNRQKLEKEKSKTKGVYLTQSAKYKALHRGFRSYIGTFDTKEAAIHAIEMASGKTKEQLKQELQEKNEQAIREKVAAGQRVTVSPGVVHLSARKYQASILGLSLGRFDTVEAAKDAIKMASGKTKKQLKQELQEKKETKGVTLTASGKYQAAFKGLHLGTFDTKEAAIHAFNLALGKTKEQHKAAKEEQKRVAAERVAEARAKSNLHKRWSEEQKKKTEEAEATKKKKREEAEATKKKKIEEPEAKKKKRDEAEATKKKIGKKKINKREQSRLDGNGSFKSFSEVNFNNLCHDLKNKVNVVDNATFNNTETTVNFDPKIERHQKLKSVVSKQTFSCTIPVTNALSVLLALYSTDGKFDPERFFEIFMRNCNPLAKIQLGVSYKKADISGFSKNNYQLQAKGNEFLIKLANCIGITEQDIVVRSMIQAMGGSGKEMNFHRDDTALLRFLVSVTEEKGGAVYWAFKTGEQDVHPLLIQQCPPGVTVTIMGDVSKLNTVWKSTGETRNPLQATHSGRGLNRLVCWFEVDLDAMVEKNLEIELTNATIEGVVRLILEENN